MTALAQRPEGANEKPGGIPTPPDIADRLQRGRKDMRKDHALRRLCHKFFIGQHYWYLDARSALRVLSTALVDVTGGKPGHRIRKTYNFFGSIIEGKVSASTGTTPGYEIDPSSNDLEDVAASRIAEQVAYYGYDKWHLRRARKKVYTNAFVQRYGFAFPYFDPCVGPYLKGPDGRLVGLGEVKVETFTRSEVMWEPEMEFMDSPWHAIERAVLIDQIRRMPGYIGGALSPNATIADLPSEKRSDKMAVLTDYMERPCEQYPQGRRCFIAGGRVVVNASLAQDYYGQADQARPYAGDAANWWEDYPFMDATGVVADEPAIHMLSYTVNPEAGEDDLGLGERLVDLSTTINDCWNKILEWKNRCLMPRYMAPRGSNIRTNDVPGGIDYFTLDPINPTVVPKPETPPAIPRELFQILDTAINQLRTLGSDVDVQPDPRLTSDTAQAAVGQAQARWSSFLGDAAEFESRLMRHCLCIVARYYTEQRIIDIRGRHGWEPPKAFTGSDLRSQVNVRVNKTSIAGKDRAQTMADVTFMQTNFPGALNPEAVWAALHGGSEESLFKTYQLDYAKASDVAQRLSGGVAAAAAFGWRQDMDFGDPALGYMVPGWMPRKVDNVAVWKQVFGDFMKEDLFGRLPPETQHLYDTVYDGLDHQEQQRKLQLVAQEQGMATQLGGMNAARPQPPAPLASPAPLSAAQAAPAALTPKQ